MEMCHLTEQHIEKLFLQIVLIFVMPTTGEELIHRAITIDIDQFGRETSLSCKSNHQGATESITGKKGVLLKDFHNDSDWIVLARCKSLDGIFGQCTGANVVHEAFPGEQKCQFRSKQDQTNQTHSKRFKVKSSRLVTLDQTQLS